MVELNHRDRTIKVKLVYYGPPLGGKTTNLHVLHRCADARRRGEMISINSAQDRTILFDLLPLRTPGFRGFDLRLQVLAVPGQAMYAATRRLVLKGADALVFVANSALDRWEENIQSLREMTQNLLSHHLDPAAMPLVFQYNKRDLPQVLEIEALDRALNTRKVDAIPAVAVRGEGILETFTAALARTAQDLAARYAILDVKEGAPAWQWAEQAVRDLFGAARLSVEPAPAPSEQPPAAAPRPAAAAAVSPPAAATAPSPSVVAPASPPVAPPPHPASARAGYTVVRVAPPPAPEDVPRAAGPSPDVRASELVESYAEASAQLGAALTELREERDLARHRLDDLRRTMETAQQVLSGTPVETALQPVLVRMAHIAGAERGAFWVPQTGKPPRAAALLAFAADPILASPAALRHVIEAAARGAKPVFVFAADNPDLAQALDRPEGKLAAVLVVPFRTPGGLQGLAVLYYGADTARPGPDTLDHLAEIPRALAAALELAATLHTVKAAERALELALAGSASLQGLQDMVRSVEQLRDRLGEIRQHPDAPPWFVEQFASLAPTVGSALADGRSLLAFSRGEIRRDSVYLEDLLAELRTPEVSVDIDPAVETVSVDPTLLRVALRAIADEVRARVGSNTAPLTIRARADGARVRVSLGTTAPLAGAAGGGSVTAGLGLGVARRIAELHGGALEETPDPGAASTPGSTAELVLSLPTA